MISKLETITLNESICSPAMKKSSKIGQNYKALISAFAYYLIAIDNV